MLIYEPGMMDPSLPTGLWWVRSAEEVHRRGYNAVCLAIGAEWKDVELCGDYLGQFGYIFVAAPPGEWRDKVTAELTDRLTVPVVVPAGESFRDCGSLLEYIDAFGEGAADKLLYKTRELPVQGLLNLAEVDLSAKRDARRTLSGVPMLDKLIGGFSGGAVSVWTGKRGEGKSTLLGQLLLEAVQQCHRVCGYSGEMPKDQFKRALLQQAAGPRYVAWRDDPRSGRRFYAVQSEAAQAIDRWWDKCLFLTDIGRDNAHDEDTILGLFEYARRRYGCDTFLVDNIMTAQLKEESRVGIWQAQSAFTGRLTAFAKKCGVHVHLVAHPRKLQRGDQIQADDVGGSVDITNRADNGFKLERVPEDKLETMGCSAVLTILKNREFGAQGHLKLDFNEKSRRFFQPGGADGRRFSWEREVAGSEGKYEVPF